LTRFLCEWPVGSSISQSVGAWDARMVRVCWPVIFVYRGNIPRQEAIGAPGGIGLRGAGRRDFIGPAVPIAVLGRHGCCVFLGQRRGVVWVNRGWLAEIRGADLDAVGVAERRFLDRGGRFAVIRGCSCQQTTQGDWRWDKVEMSSAEETCKPTNTAATRVWNVHVSRAQGDLGVDGGVPSDEGNLEAPPLGGCYRRCQNGYPCMQPTEAQPGT
jgi:hypothetical protein